MCLSPGYLKRHPAFEGLKDEELYQLIDSGIQSELLPGEVLIKEGEYADKLYLIVSGSFDLLGSNQAKNMKISVGKLEKNQLFGEISLIDEQKRSVTVSALEKSIVISFPYVVVRRILDQERKKAQLLNFCAKSICQRLRNANFEMVRYMEMQISIEKLRYEYGKFFVSIICGICIFMFGILGISNLIKEAHTSTIVTLPLSVAVAIFVFLLYKFSALKLGDLGITRKNIKKSFFYGIVVTAPIVIILILFLKYILIKFDSDYSGMKLLEPFQLIQDSTNKNWYYWFLINGIYAFIEIPIQELVARGAIQNSLENFFSGKHKVFWSILVSNLIFSSLHVIFSSTVALIVFFAGCYFGWIYSRTHNLISSICAHICVGVMGLSIVGLIPQ